MKNPSARFRTNGMTRHGYSTAGRCNDSLNRLKRSHMRSISLAIIIVAALVHPAAAQMKTDASTESRRLFVDNVMNISEAMVNDVTPPATASRYYAYSILAAYEVALIAGRPLPDFTSQFRTTITMNKPALPQDFNYEFCANYAMLETGRRMIPQGAILIDYQKAMTKKFEKEKKIPARSMAGNIAFAEAVADQVVQYSRTDGYNTISTYPRYTPKKMGGYWYPTPPAFLAAADAHWSKVRPFFLDSANQFNPPPPIPFSTDTASTFYKLAKEVYLAKSTMTDDQRELANFWDCNPFSLAYSGHMEIGIKKISPGGHWLGIAGIACKQAKVNLDTMVLVHTAVALALNDAFIVCWYHKFNVQRLRPETYINKYIDPSWRPLLQTPPFPDYLSGHSTVSPAASAVLTYFFGDHFTYVDTSEVIYGLPPRKFESFYKAAKEASESRVYGGIHFRDACREGFNLGTKIGDFMLLTMFNHVNPAH